MENIFAQAQKNGELNQTSVSSREDENFYYYELNFSGFNKEEISVKIENNSLTFAAQNKKEISQVKKEDKNHKDSSSSFYYSFSLTQFDNKKEPKIIRQDNKIIVKLSKKILKS
jgi:HSP20 family molecular chaperone IbpA